MDPLTDPDYTLIVRVHDMGGMSENALMGSATVHIVVEQNLWVSPGPITVSENLQETYPIVIGQVRISPSTYSRKCRHDLVAFFAPRDFENVTTPDITKNSSCRETDIMYRDTLCVLKNYLGVLCSS